MPSVRSMMRKSIGEVTRGELPIECLIKFPAEIICAVSEFYTEGSDAVNRSLEARERSKNMKPTRCVITSTNIGRYANL